MKIVYDPKRDILQITLATRSVAETSQITPNLVLDYDEDGKVVGLELRNASERTDNPYAMSYLVGDANMDKPQPYMPKKSGS